MLNYYTFFDVTNKLRLTDKHCIHKKLQEMESQSSANNNDDHINEIHSLEEGRYSTDHDYNETASAKSQRTMRSRRKPKRKGTIFSNSTRQRTNSSFQYPSNMSVFSSGVSINSPVGSVTSPSAKQTPRLQSLMPSTYHYEIVPTSFPNLEQDRQSDEEPLSGLHESTVDGHDDHANTSMPPNVRTINNGSKVIVKPKQIHQNPLTPAMLPKGFTPINNWGRVKNKYHKEWLAEFLRHPRNDNTGRCMLFAKHTVNADTSAEVL